MNEKVSTLLNDEVFLEAFIDCETLPAAQKLLADNGVEMSIQEVDAILRGLSLAAIDEDEEIQDDVLENIAGGAAIPMLALYTISPEAKALLRSQ